MSLCTVTLNALEVKVVYKQYHCHINQQMLLHKQSQDVSKFNINSKQLVLY